MKRLICGLAWLSTSSAGLLFLLPVLFFGRGRIGMSLTPVSASGFAGTRASSAEVIGGGEAPTFKLDTGGVLPATNQTESAGQLRMPTGTLEARVSASSGGEARLQPILKPVAPGSSQYIIKLLPREGARPGLYKLEARINSPGGQQQIAQDFSWGVLAVNLDKSTYQPSETVKLGLAVLDDNGTTLCDAKLSLTIASPAGQATTLSTANGQIRISPSCADKRVTDDADYQAEYRPTLAGHYRLEVTAVTPRGERKTRSDFEVKPAPAFVTHRFQTATRIYPAVEYTSRLTLTAAGAASGNVVESLPATFEVSQAKLTILTAGGQALDSRAGELDKNADRQLITWKNVRLFAGQSAQISYNYRAPMISPEFYTLGPLRLVSREQTMFSEPRAWQIAADAVGGLIMLWDPADGAIPSGWTCLSCAAGDAFYQRFPRAAASYGVQGGGPETGVTHSYTSTTVSGPSATVTSTAPVTSVAVGSASHTHTFGGGPFTSGGAAITPPYGNLRVIQSNQSASSLSTLPANIIGLFDLPNASLPAGWTNLAALNGQYLRGENTTCTASCGAASHSHARPSTSTLASGGPSATTNVQNLGANGASSSTHTHSLASVAGPTDNNAPAFASVNFAKNSVAGAALPNALMAFFDSSSLPVGWNSLSASGASYENRLLKGSSDPTVGRFGGSDSHSHGGSETITTGAASATANNTLLTGGTLVASPTHTHSASFTVGSANSLPLYTTAILARYSSINVSGTVYSDEAVTALGSQPVKLVSAGSAQRTVTAAANGTYSADIADPGSGGVITVYLDSNGGPAAATTTRSAAAAISGLDLYQNRLIVRHEDAGPLSNADLGQCTKAAGSACTDSDLHYSVTGGNLLVDNDWRLYIWAGKSFTPGGQVTLAAQSVAASVGGDLKWGSSTAVLNMGANSLSVGGDWLNGAGGSFSRTAAQLTTLTATGSGFVIDAASKNFASLTINGSGGAWSFTPAATAANVDGDLTITAGSLTAPSGSLNLGGSLANSASFIHNSGTLALVGTAAGKTLRLGSSSLYNLTINGSGGVWSPLTNPLNIVNDLIMTAGSLDNSNGSADVSVGGNATGTAGVINLTAGSFSQRASASRSFGTTGGLVDWTFNDLTFSNSNTTATAVVFTAQAGSGGITINGVLRVGAVGDTAGAASELNAGSSGRTWTLAGSSGTPFVLLASPAASLTAGSSTFSYTGNNPAGDTVVTAAPYNNLAIGGAAAENYNPSGPLTLSGNLTANSSGVLIGNQNITVNGNVAGAGQINLSGGVFLQRIQQDSSFGSSGGSLNWTFNILKFETSAAADRIITMGAGSGLTTTNGDVTIGNAADSNNVTLQAGSNNRSLNLLANLTITTKGILTAPGSASFSIGGNYLNSGVFNNNNGQISFVSAVTGKTINSGGTGPGKDFYVLSFNNAAGGWTIQTNDLKTQSSLSLLALSQFTVESGRTVTVNGTFSLCDSCPSGTTWTGATLLLNSTSSYTIGSKNQTAEVYGTLQVAAGTNVKLWKSDAASFNVSATGSVYSQNHAAVAGRLNIYGLYHVTATDYWSYATDFDGATLTGGTRRQAVVRLETGVSRGTTVDAGASLNVSGGGTATGQYTDIDRLTASGNFQLINNGTSAISEAKIANSVFAGGTWRTINSQLSAYSVTAGTLNVDWYLGLHLVDRDQVTTNLATAATDITLSENSATPAATVFKRAGGNFGAGAASQTTASDASGHNTQPGTDGALAIREYSQTSSGFTYYKYNVRVNSLSAYADYDFNRDYGTFITSSANPGAGLSAVVGSGWYRDDIASENAHGPLNGGPNTGSWLLGLAKAVIAFWDSADGALPSGWACVSCASGDAFYQKFLRAAPSYGGTGGGPDSLGHALTAPSAAAGASFAALTGLTNVADGAHTHAWNYGAAPNTTLGDIRPPFKNLKVMRGPFSGPLSWPVNLISPFRTATAPSGWAAYAPLTSSYVRGENNNLSGGATTHGHTANALTGAAATPSVLVSAVGSGVSSAAAAHTHTLGGTSPADDLTTSNNDPLHVNVAFMKHTAAGGPPSDLLGLFDYAGPPTGFSVVSSAAPYQNNLLVGATTSLETSAGCATHSHASPAPACGNTGSKILTTSAPSAVTPTAEGAGTSAATAGHTHQVTYTVSSETAMPSYRDVVVARYTAVTNTPPNLPTTLAQYRVTAGTLMNTGDWTNESQVKFQAVASDTDNPDSLQLCVEKKPLGTAFTGSEDGCGPAVSYAGTAVTVSLTLSGLTDATEYHWQARIKDAGGAYSAWLSYGGNAETARDFGVDTTPPTGGTVYGNYNTDSLPLFSERGENGDGSLNTLSASWNNFNTAVSGLAKYQYSIGSAAGATDLRAWTDSGSSGADNFIRATGLALQTNKNYFINVRAIDNAANTSAVVSSPAQLVTPTISFQIDIGGASDPGTTMPPYNLDFGTLATGSVTPALQRAWLSLATNGSSGAQLLIKGQNSGLNSALAGYNIISVSTDLAATANGYGGQLIGFSSSSGTLSGSAPYNGAGDNVGLLDGAYRLLISSSGPLVGGRIQFGLKAKIDSLVPAANDYRDVLTLTAAAAY